MTRRLIGLFVILALAILVAPLAADAQQMKHLPRIGVLSVGLPPASPDWKQQWLFLQGLRQLGWVEGQNLAFEYRWADERPSRLADLAAELVRLQVDVVVAPDTQALGAVKQATTTSPIVMLAPVDPVAWGYVGSLARPGGNITGVGGQVQELSTKLLELLKEAVPEVTRVAVLANPRQPDIRHLLTEPEGAARALSVQPHLLEVPSPDALERAYETANKEGVGALLILPGLLFSLHDRRLAALAVQHRLPAIYTTRSSAEAGGLLAYGPKPAEVSRLGAGYVDRLLKGGKPADLPVERPTAFELVINLKTAQALGLTMPPILLFQAAEVIR
jgi:putative tryptophan/tyrosine transport system substrate-binding protein